MGAVDWVLLAIIGASALLGVMRGFVGVVVSLVAWLLSDGKKELVQPVTLKK